MYELMDLRIFFSSSNSIFFLSQNASAGITQHLAKSAHYQTQLKSIVCWILDKHLHIRNYKWWCRSYLFEDAALDTFTYICVVIEPDKLGYQGCGLREDQIFDIGEGWTIVKGYPLWYIGLLHLLARKGTFIYVRLQSAYILCRLRA